MKHRVLKIDEATHWGTCDLCGEHGGFIQVRKPTKKDKDRKVWICPRKIAKPVGRRKKPTAKQTLTNKCDTEWSLLVRERSGYKCALAGFEKECGGAMQAHHLVGRTEEATRWVPENGVCLCYSHHIYGVHGTKATQMNHELFKRLPAGLMDELNEIRRKHRESNVKIDRAAVLAELKRLLELAA